MQCPPRNRSRFCSPCWWPPPASAQRPGARDTGRDAYGMETTLDDGTVSVTVTRGDAGVENVSVAVDGESVGETDANGTVTVDRPDDDSFEVTVETASAELKGEYVVENGSLALEKSEFEMEDDAEENESEEDESEEEADESEEDESEEEADESEEDESEEEADESEEGAADEDDENATAEADASANARAGASAQQGPPASLSERVPGHVAAIQDLLGSFLSGNLGAFGPATSGAAR
ncbi:hypothetical protein ACFQL0_18425 [Haloplanus litoreus]